MVGAPGSAGVTLAEMGQLMKSLGAMHAFNLDGGGSTVMARFNASSGRFAVANRPSDGRQRPATQAFAAFRSGLRASSDDEATNGAGRRDRTAAAIGSTEARLDNRASLVHSG